MEGICSIEGGKRPALQTYELRPAWECVQLEAILVTVET